MSEHTFLVAFTVDTLSGDRSLSEALLADYLPEVDEVVTSYWVAEDDRRDRSDCDSAVFVDPGRQEQANRVLHLLGLQSRTGTSWQDDLPTHAYHAKALDAMLDRLTETRDDPEASDDLIAEDAIEALNEALDLLDSLGVFFGQVTE